MRAIADTKVNGEGRGNRMKRSNKRVGKERRK